LECGDVSPLSAAMAAAPSAESGDKSPQSKGFPG
jgi:hypothetical protein